MVAAKLCLVLGGRGWWQQNNDWSWVVVDGGVKLWLVVGGGGKIMVARGCSWLVAAKLWLSWVVEDGRTI